MKTYQRYAAAALMTAVMSVGIGALTAGSADAVPLPASSTAASSSNYQAASTAFVYESPDFSSTKVAQVFAGEVIQASADTVIGPDGTAFRYAWTFNYRTGHFFHGYVEDANIDRLG